MSGTEFRLILPICKVNEEQRTVEGYATTDAIDKQNEQVDYDASREAFKDWTGNIREMHEPKAVGKAIEWRPDDAKRGMYVVAKISKGAPDTWEKIKDGTLKAFSIGGQTVNKIQQIVKDGSTGGQRHITRITKYKLTELSLVDNPANPEATIGLVKFADGIPTQTEVVEDIKKVLISEATDILDDEVREHRDKADSLVKKVLSSGELEKLDSEQWGVVRKFERDGKQFIERFLPMPDKVHAVRALGIVDKYNLNEEESSRVHELAKSVLGSDYEFYSSLTNRGGEIRKMNKEILDAVKALAGRLEQIEARFAKTDAGASSDIKTQEEGNVAPKKKDDKDAGGEFEGKVPAEGAKKDLPDVAAKDGGEAPVKTQEEGNVAPKKKDDKDAGGDYEGAVPAEGAKQALPDVGAKAGKPSLKTQEEGNVAPVKKDAVADAAEEAAETPEEEAVELDAEGKPVKKAKNPATSSLKTQEEGNVAPVKKSLDSPKEIKEAADGPVLKELQALRKRLDAIESAPLPRKYHKVEKRFGTPDAEHVDSLAEDRQKCIELRKAEQAGKKLTPDENQFIETTLKKSFDAKFSKSL